MLIKTLNSILDFSTRPSGATLMKVSKLEQAWGLDYVIVCVQLCMCPKYTEKILTTLSMSTTIVIIFTCE